jgi:hypothetical protein
VIKIFLKIHSGFTKLEIYEISKMSKRKEKNIIRETRSMFDNGFEERHDLEQYFWTERTVNKLIQSLRFIPNCCCLTTPSLGHGFYQIGREEIVLDIDTRFEYLPKFQYFDILVTHSINEEIRIIVMDPPFFYIPMEQIYNAVLKITEGDTKCKLMIGFLIREEKALLHTFTSFNLKRTNFPLEYATARPNKWKNYALYSNIDLPGIKRRKE